MKKQEAHDFRRGSITRNSLPYDMDHVIIVPEEKTY